MIKRAVAVTLASATALMGFAASVEIWARATQQRTRGRPGLFIGDAVRVEKLAPDYDGWFFGVPVHTNNLGFRDQRDYDVTKGPHTFRILIFGDSVTFGHGSIYKHT